MIASIKLTKDGKGWKLPLSGYNTSVSFSEWATIFSFKRSYMIFELQVEGPLTIISNGRQMTINQKPTGEQQRQLNKLIQTPVQSILGFTNGELHINFEESNSILVAKSEKFEPWNLTGPNGLRITSVPGGELSLWQSKD